MSKLKEMILASHKIYDILRCYYSDFIIADNEDYDVIFDEYEGGNFADYFFKEYFSEYKEMELNEEELKFIKNNLEDYPWYWIDSAFVEKYPNYTENTILRVSVLHQAYKESK